jgi:curved DNA-binding protein CbpA
VHASRLCFRPVNFRHAVPVFCRCHKTIRMTDHYTTLGLSSSATLAEVKKAFRQKASVLHPDKNAAADAAQRFRAAQQAYEVLSDAGKRQAYDDNRRRNLLDSPIDTATAIWKNYFSQLL